MYVCVCAQRACLVVLLLTKELLSCGHGLPGIWCLTHGASVDFADYVRVPYDFLRQEAHALPFAE